MKILFYVTNEILKGVNGMEHNQYHDKIRKVAMDFDKAVESRNVIFILSSFTDNCEIELLGVKLIGKKGVEKWISWLYKHIVEIKFLPITIMIDGDTFFEEFVVKARLHNGIEIQSKQAELIIYKDFKIRNLRLYFDRLDFADSIVKGPINKAILRKLLRKSLDGLI